MLAREIASEPFNKAQRNQALQKLIPRSRKAIEFKHCNISAVLEGLGMPTIRGYRPLPHFQNALVDGIGRHLATRNAPELEFHSVGSGRVALATSLWIGPPPSPSPLDDKDTEKLRRLVRKFDPAERDARNRELGRRGEELVLRHERDSLIAVGREDLARKLEWTSEERGHGAGYDIRSFEPNGSERLIEVKTTNGLARTPFFLSENERSFSEERPDAFRLLRLYDFAKRPSAFELIAPLQQHLRLSPTTYRASF